MNLFDIEVEKNSIVFSKYSHDDRVNFEITIDDWTSCGTVYKGFNIHVCLEGWQEKYREYILKEYNKHSYIIDNSKKI